MSGISTTGVHTANDYQLGHGILYMAELDINGRPKGYRDLGNTPNVSCSVSKETLAHYSSRHRLKVVDKRVTTQVSADLKFTLENINFNNLALFYSGECENYTNPAIAGVVAQTFVESGDLVVNRWYQIRTSEGQPIFGITSINDIEVHAVVGEEEPTLLTKDVDYSIETIEGILFVADTGTTQAAVAAGAELQVTLTADAAASPVDHLKILSSTELNVALMFILEDADSGKKTSHFYHTCSVTSEGDYNLSSDDWSQLPMSASIELNDMYLQPGDVYFVKEYSEYTTYWNTQNGLDGFWVKLNDDGTLADSYQYPEGYAWSAEDYLYALAYYGGTPAYIPAHPVEGGIGPDEDWFTYDGTHIILVKDA